MPAAALYELDWLLKSLIVFNGLSVIIINNNEIVNQINYKHCIPSPRKDLAKSESFDPCTGVSVFLTTSPGLKGPRASLSNTDARYMRPIFAAAWRFRSKMTL